MSELWYKDAIFYELHVKAFQDGNGDGIGDFRGLTERLGYLQDLGVDCLWLLPFYPSPLRDDGYDIADYYGVAPGYGTMADFEEFLREAHRRGIRVVTDLVVNHTSDQHPWFQEARRDPASGKRAWYVWSDDDKRYRDARIIFVDTEMSNWTWDPVARAYYWHRFFGHQPDLNYDNPAVQQAMLDVMRFWLDKGLDGFRCDAVPYLFEREGTSCENLPETHAFLKRLRAEVDGRYRHRVLLAEANQWPEDVRQYFGAGDEFHMAFHFPLMPRMFMALHSADRRPITDMFLHTPAIPETCQWCLFLRNHDELTLEMCTDPERDYMYYAYAQDPLMKLNVGIRRRLAPLVGNDRGKLQLLHALLFSLPGTPVIYYGDEIGMGDNIHLGDRNGVRTPMQWSGDRNAGFSLADPATLYSPVIADPLYGHQAVSVEAQLGTPASLLSWMRRIIAVRRTTRVFGRGSLRFLEPANTRVLAYLREWSGETILVVANLAASAEPVELNLRAYRDAVPSEMFGGALFPAIGEQPYFLSLAPHGFYWFRLIRAGSPAQTPYGIENRAI
jgi:maltose alpha-D-glucosyltransferase/alpha-amylase